MELVRRYLFPTLLLLTVGATGGCFRYLPGEVGDLQNGDRIRVRITAQQASELDEALMRDSRVLEASVVEAGTPLLLEVPSVSQLRGARVETLNQRVALDHSHILEVEHRQLDRTRTGLLVGGTAAVVLGVVVRSLLSEAGGDTRIPDGPLPEDRIRPVPVFQGLPVFQLRVPGWLP